MILLGNLYSEAGNRNILHKVEVLTDNLRRYCIILLMICQCTWWCHFPKKLRVNVYRIFNRAILYFIYDEIIDVLLLLFPSQ
jgi:hypothetical protein